MIIHSTIFLFFNKERWGERDRQIDRQTDRQRRRETETQRQRQTQRETKLSHCTQLLAHVTRRELRQRLGSMNVSTTVSSVTSLRPHTTPAPTLRRLKAPPVIVKLNVRVPINDSSSKDSDADNDSDGEVDDDDSSDDGARNRMRQQQRRMKVAWAESEEEKLDKFAAKQDVKKVTK